MRKRINELYDVIKKSKEAIEKIQESCKHPKLKDIDYQWRIGSTIPATACTTCDKIVKTAFFDSVPTS